MEENQQLEFPYDELSDVRIVMDGNGNIMDEYKQSEKVEKSKRQMEAAKRIKAKENSKNIVKEFFGNYFHYVYSKIPKEVSSINKVYLLKLATTLDYNSEYIMIEHKNSPNHNRTKKSSDIQKLSGMKSRGAFYDFKCCMEKNNILKKDENGYFLLNSRYVVYGDINKKGGYTRVFIDGFNKTFDNAKQKDKVFLGYSLELLQYCNLRYNVITKDIEEIDSNKIVPMSITEIAEILGVTDQNSTRLITGLRSVKIDGDFLFMVKGVRKETVLYVNPNVFYGGQADEDAISFMKDMFSIKTKES